ncbi:MULTISPECIES: circadian clock KaiB family protein [unclassified Microcoleus]|uniref:circadian clock KaiB family protein n=1 Tax=unclassified Microcoleus TaxID=2642155 RepID=UPI002FCFAB03
MKVDRPILPEFFKGIALFTPGGDLIYCIDSRKQTRWHLQLCVALQEILGLSEPPHFLIPCYTATVDCWLDPSVRQLRVAAEAYPPVLRHQTLLNAIFGTGDLVWHPRSEEMCEPMAIATYHEQFPELWENHDLVVQYPSEVGRSDFRSSIVPPSRFRQSQPMPPTKPTALTPPPQTRGYVLRLFVSGSNPSTERTLETLHQLLEQCLDRPYTLKVIDVLKHPEQAEADQISATPTLIKIWPKPVRRIVGELNDDEKIVRLLSNSEF